MRILKEELPTVTPRRYDWGSCVWSLNELAQAAVLGHAMFLDIVALLVDDGYIRKVKDGVVLSDSGRAFILKGGYELSEKSTGTIYSFKSHLTRKQERLLTVELKEQNISATPTQLISFLKGKNTAKFSVEKLHHLAYLLYRLVKEDYIHLEGSKGYFKQFELALIHNSIKVGNGGLRELKRQVVDKKHNGSSVQIVVDKIIEKLKAN